eukprot:5826903-Pyramimonas_sp.AAC.1
MSPQSDTHSPPTDDASLLIVLVDASAAFWDERYGGGTKALSLGKFFEQASQTAYLLGYGEYFEMNHSR